jgi:broad specificity phosphatase PhoE
MIIYLVRHGETTGDLEDRFGGDYDDHLTPHGEQESRELAAKLKGKGIKTIYCSPKLRALETATFVAAATKAEIEVINDLRERNHYGVLTGMVKADAKVKHPEHLEELKKGIHHNLKGSESYPDFKKRVLKAFAEAVGEGESPMMILTHGGVIKCIVREILKKGEMENLGDCAILTIEKTDKGISLVNLDGAKLEG